MRAFYGWARGFAGLPCSRPSLRPWSAWGPLQAQSRSSGSTTQRPLSSRPLTNNPNSKAQLAVRFAALQDGHRATWIPQKCAAASSSRAFSNDSSHAQQRLSRSPYARRQGFRESWQSSPRFRYGIAGTVGGAVVFYLWNVEEVPVSGRRRFNATPANWEEGMSKQLYDQTLEQYRGRILPSYDPRARMVTRVLDRLIPKAGLTPEETEHTNWEIFVIDDPEQKNAFVIPGGKVFVFSGILPICRGEDGLAAVLGHEIAHNVAHHAAERISQAFLVFGVVQVIMFLYGAPDIFSRILFDTVFLKPGSRKQESEADYIGVLMMAKACYNPEAAVGLWQRMAEAEQHAPPQWLSTHPSSANRMERIKGWLPEAEDKRKQGGCGSTSGFANDFRRTLTQNVWRDS